MVKGTIISKLRTAVLLIVFAVLAINSIQPLKDPDLFWHIKTGELIYQERSLPAKDPFSLMETPMDSRSKFILTGYWLSQLIFYFVHSLLGFPGIAFLRVVIFLLIIYLLYRQGISYDLNEFFMVMGFLSLLYLAYFPYNTEALERPQIFSFLFTVILIYLLERYRVRNSGQTLTALENNPPSPPLRAMAFTKGGKGGLYAIPIMMLFWANMHGGFILSDVILGIYLISEGIKLLFRLKGAMPKKRFKHFIFIASISMVFSLINPNTYYPFLEFIRLKGSHVAAGTSEFLSPYKLYMETWDRASLFYFITLIFYWTIFVIGNFKKRWFDLTDILLLIFLSSISILHLRFIPFLFFGGFIFFTKSLSYLLPAIRYPLPANRYRLIAIFMRYGIIAFFIFSLIPLGSATIKWSWPPKWVGGWFPEEATRFILINKNKLKGPMYNPYEWGGYLIWRLYPEYKVFIDGRVLNESNVMKAAKVTFTFPGWESILDEYGINLIITPVVHPLDGTIMSLPEAIIKKDEWRLIFLRENSALYIKDVKADKNFLWIYNLPKDFIYNEILNVTAIHIITGTKNPNFYISRGDVFLRVGIRDKAMANYSKALSLTRDNKGKERMMRRLKEIGG